MYIGLTFAWPAKTNKVVTVWYIMAYILYKNATHQSMPKIGAGSNG